MRVIVVAGLWVSLVLGSVVGGGCAGILQEGKTTFLKPSAVSSAFKDLDAENPLAKGTNKVEVQKVGIPAYDAFFRETAEIEGTVVLADVVLKEVDTFIARTKKEMAGGKVLTQRQLADLEKRQARIDEVIKLLGSVPERSSTLLDKGETLTKGAGKTFVGPNAFKLPGVVKGLELSATSLREAGSRSPKVLEHATKTSTSLAGLK